VAALVTVYLLIGLAVTGASALPKGAPDGAADAAGLLMSSTNNSTFLIKSINQEPPIAKAGNLTPAP
jgi:hypothetical protein